MKRFIISEQEKIRILNMYKNRDSNHYLTEQGLNIDTGTVFKNIMKNKKACMDFQKWIKENYPQTNLGNTGPNKDGVDGFYGRLTKKAFDQYGNEYTDKVFNKPWRRFNSQDLNSKNPEDSKNDNEPTKREKKSRADEVKKMTDLQNEIEKLLSYYSIRNGKVWDNEYNKEVDPETLRKLGPYYKAQIESVYVGCEEDNKNSSAIDNIKQEIITGPFKDLIGDYDKIPIEKNQYMDYYTDIKCQYYRTGKDSQGNPIDIKNRPWCLK